LNSDIRIIPQDSLLILWVIDIRTFVTEVGHLGQHAESVGKTWRDVELPMIFVRKDDTFPFAECRRACAEINGYIKNCPPGNIEEFPLGISLLKVKAAKNTLAGTRLIVLHKRLVDSEIRIALRTKSF